MTSTAEADDLAYDGRRARRDRNSEAVLRACWSLFMEGQLQPTAQQVAERSGVSLRSVFRHFQNLDGLLVAAVDWYLEEHGEYFVFTPPAPGASLDERIDAVVEWRFRLYQHSGREIMAGLVLAAQKPEIEARVGPHRGAVPRVLSSVFAAELAALDDAARRTAIGMAHATLSVDVWDLLTRHHAFDEEQFRHWYRTGVHSALTHPEVNRQ